MKIRRKKRKEPAMTRLAIVAIFLFPIILMADLPRTKAERRAAYEKAIVHEKAYQLEYCDRVGKATAQRIKKLKAVIAGTEEDDKFLIDDEGNRYTLPRDHKIQLSEAREKLRKLKKKKRRLEKDEIEITPLLRLKELTIGEIGQIDLDTKSRELKVREILDKRRMVVDLVEEVWVNEDGKVVPKDHFVAVVLLHGINTRPYTEGEKIAISDLFIVTQEQKLTLKQTDNFGNPHARNREVFVLSRFKKDWEDDEESKGKEQKKP